MKYEVTSGFSLEDKTKYCLFDYSFERTGNGSNKTHEQFYEKAIVYGITSGFNQIMK